MENDENCEAAETPEEWAARMTGKIRGLMKEEIAAHGGAEGYMRWVRSDPEEPVDAEGGVTKAP
jgi:hypothetical protein